MSYTSTGIGNSKPAAEQVEALERKYPMFPVIGRAPRVAVVFGAWKLCRIGLRVKLRAQGGTLAPAIDELNGLSVRAVVMPSIGVLRRLRLMAQAASLTFGCNPARARPVTRRR